MGVPLIVTHGAVHGVSQILQPLTTSVSMIGNSILPVLTPEPNELMDLAIRGWITEKDLEKRLLPKGVYLNISGTNTESLPWKFIGNVPGPWAEIYYAKQEIGTVDQFLTIANRKLWPDEQVVNGLKRWGFYAPNIKEEITNLRYDIPSSSDLVRFSVRHVFEPDLIKRLGYNDEFRPILDLWHRFQGLNYQIFTGPFKQQVAQFETERGVPPGSFFASYVEQGLADPTWAQAFWWSHWVLPSPSQGYLAYFRLRPDRDKRYDGPEALGLNFSYDDLALLLRANDYPPKYRAMLAAIARPIPGVRFARDFRVTGVYDEPALFEWALRQGYSDKDAGDIATDIDQWATKKEQAAASCKGCNVVEKAYEVGIIDRPMMQTMFGQLGLPAKQAQARAELTDVDLETRRAREVISSLRRQFLAGKISADQARLLLAQYGLVANRIGEYLTDWELEKATNFKEIAAQKVIKWACQGIVSILDLQKRLTNLGYAPDDITGMIVEAELCAQTLAARAVSAAAKAAEATQRKLIQAQKAAAQAIQQARRALASHGSPTQLRKWFCEGHIGQPELSARLDFLGWPDVDIARLIADCKAPGKPGKGGATGPGGTAGP